MASDGQLRVIGSANKKKQEKNNSDSRLSVTAVRVGSAAGSDLVRLYLAKGQEEPLENLKPGNFARHHVAPNGSGVIMTPNAFMTDEAWLEAAPLLSEGIREAPVIRDHPDWWVILSLDGFGSHLGAEALIIFHNHKILVVKEEGDTSQVSQAYDQLVAKSDKRVLREFLDTYRSNVHRVVTQWDLILIANQALNKVPPSDWITSFHRVNLRPSTRVEFVVWVKKHEEQVSTADKLFAESDSFFDAMPAVWQHMSEEKREEICQLFSAFENVNGDPWSRDNLTQLVKAGVHVGDIIRLRGCFLVSKQDASVMKDPPPRPSTGTQTHLDEDFTCFAFFPRHLKEPYLKDKEKHGKLDKVSKLPELKNEVNIETRGELGATTLHLKDVESVDQIVTCWPKDRDRRIAGNAFRYMCNFVAETHKFRNNSAVDIHVSGFKDDHDLLPSPGLDVHVTRMQRNLLNPNAEDVQKGELLSQSHGEKARKKLAKRKVHAISGNVNSYARVLNGEHQMKDVKDYNALAASLSVFQRERAEQDEQRQREKKRTDEAKAAKKRAKEEQEKAEREMLLPGCKEDVEVRGKAYVLGCNLTRKKQIIKYYFEHKGPISSLKRDDVNALIEKFFSEMLSGDDQPPALVGDDVAGNTDVNNALLSMIEAVDDAAQVLIGSVDEERDEEPRRTGRKRKMTEKGGGYAESRM